MDKSPTVQGSQTTAPLTLSKHSKILVRQRHEVAELLGFETRNKYELLDENQNQIGFAAEQQKGLWGFLARSFLGHWRKFDVFIFNHLRQQVMTAHHPFRFFFQRLEVRSTDGQYLGAVQQRFSILSKRFDIEDRHGREIFNISSPIWKIWTFPIYQRGRQIAAVKKKWSGALFEVFTDKDNFLVEFDSLDLTEEQRHLVLASAFLIDLQYFEKKANSN